MKENELRFITTAYEIMCPGFEASGREQTPSSLLEVMGSPCFDEYIAALAKNFSDILEARFSLPFGGSTPQTLDKYKAKYLEKELQIVELIYEIEERKAKQKKYHKLTRKLDNIIKPQQRKLEPIAQFYAQLIVAWLPSSTNDDVKTAMGLDAPVGKYIEFIADFFKHHLSYKTLSAVTEDMLGESLLEKINAHLEMLRQAEERKRQAEQAAQRREEGRQQQFLKIIGDRLHAAGLQSHQSSIAEVMSVRYPSPYNEPKTAERLISHLIETYQKLADIVVKKQVPLDGIAFEAFVPSRPLPGMSLPPSGMANILKYLGWLMPSVAFDLEGMVIRALVENAFDERYVTMISVFLFTHPMRTPAAADAASDHMADKFDKALYQKILASNAWQRLDQLDVIFERVKMAYYGGRNIIRSYGFNHRPSEAGSHQLEEGGVSYLDVLMALFCNDYSVEQIHSLRAAIGILLHAKNDGVDGLIPLTPAVWRVLRDNPTEAHELAFAIRQLAASAMVRKPEIGAGAKQISEDCWVICAGHSVCLLTEFELSRWLPILLKATKQGQKPICLAAAVGITYRHFHGEGVMDINMSMVINKLKEYAAANREVYARATHESLYRRQAWLGKSELQGDAVIQVKEQGFQFKGLLDPDFMMQLAKDEEKEQHAAEKLVEELHGGAASKAGSDAKRPSVQARAGFMGDRAPQRALQQAEELVCPQGGGASATDPNVPH